MKSYLSLIPISARVHRRQNRMTLFCIIISVFLVTAIFSMADMGIRMEGNRLIKEHGNWHIMLKNIPKSDTELIGSRSDVAAASWYDVINYKINEDYYIGGKKAALCGVEEPLVTDMMNCLTEGNFPRNDREIVLTDNVKNVLSINIGDAVTVNTPSGSFDYTVSGFAEDTSSMLQYDAVGAFMDLEAFNKVCSLNGNTDSEPVYYVQFKEHTNIRKTIADMKQQYGAMRAVGMDVRQIIKMIAAETVTYALSGCIVGCGLGLPLNRFLFEKLVTDYWGDAWTVPVITVAVILLIMVLSSAAAVYNPSKRIRNTAITDTINEL